MACAREFIAVAANEGASEGTIVSGWQITRAGRFACTSATPSGRRWNGVKADPARVVGSAATSAPLVAPTAFAVSTTRPPPNPTSGRSPAGSRRSAESSGTAPGATGSTAAASAVRASGAPDRARSVESST